MQKKNLETLLYSTAGVVVMAIILVAVNILAAAARQRVDLTKNKIYTLSDGTRRILSKIDTPVTFRFYCTQSDTATPEAVMLKAYAKKVEDLLNEYRQAAHGKIILQKLDPEPDSDAEDSAGLDGVEGQQLSDGEKFYLGLAITQVDSKEAVPFFYPEREREMEYDISRAISRVTTPDKPVVGVMSPLPVFGTPSNPMMEQMGQQGQGPWAIIGQLRQDYTVKNIAMDADKIDDDVKVLIVIHPRDITDKAQFAIDQFVLRGGRLLAFLDAESLVDSRGQNPMMGQMPGGGSSLDKLLKAWGLQFDTSKVVADRTFAMELGDAADTAQVRPVWLRITSDGIDTNDITTSELDNIWMFGAGAFTGSPAPGLKETVLMRSTPDSQLVDGMMAGMSGESILKEFKPSGISYALAVKLTGKFKTAFPDGAPEDKSSDTNADSAKPADKAVAKKSDNSLKEGTQDTAVILVGDADMIYDAYTVRRDDTPFGSFVEPMNANLNFALNAVEQLSGDNNLIAVRSRAALEHPFTRVQKIEAAADQQYMAQLNQLQKDHDEAVSRLSELQQQKSQNQRYILSPEQEAEIKNLRDKQIATSQKLHELDKERRHDIVSLERNVEVVNLATMPLLVIAAGIWLAIYKSIRTSAK